VKQLVLRGSKLANTDWVFAMVIYTGAQTKMMLNRNPTRYHIYYLNYVILLCHPWSDMIWYDKNRFKFTKFERQLNQLVIMLFIFNLCMCVIAAIVCVASNVCYLYHPYTSSLHRHAYLNTNNG
jgi:magnesium-transporting ATPase (P-type)